MSPSSATDLPPLARLFAIGYRSLIDGLHEDLRVKGWTDVRPSFGFVLLAARDQPTTVTAIASLMSTTKQAASKLLDKMETAGYVRRTTEAEDGRQRPVRLTRRGTELLATVEQIYARLEREWADVIGAERLDRLRHDLFDVVTSMGGGELPPVRPTADRAD